MRYHRDEPVFDYSVQLTERFLHNIDRPYESKNLF